MIAHTTTQQKAMDELAQENLGIKVSSERNTDMESIFGEVIYAYTREQAIEDGVLVNLGQIAREYYKYQVCLTASVLADITEGATHPAHEISAIVRDVLWMSQKGISQRIDETQHLFKVVIADQTHEYKAMCHPGDNMEPVITILQINED